METDTSVRRLARLSGVSRRTLENWLYGVTLHPRNIEPILRVAQALKLPAQDTDRLLESAGHPSLSSLKQQKKPLPAELLVDWQLAPDTLLGQRSATLPVQQNLPAATTPFLGRSEIRELLATLIKRPDARLVTVTGLGGVGKTRLSLEAAHSLVDWFDHGVYFVPLDNVSDVEGFWEAILNGLDIPNDGLDSPQQLVQNYLNNKQILLMLDNFEHLLFLTAEINNLLTNTQRLSLLATSRQALDLQAEHLCTIGGLSYEQGQESAAYQLYIQTAQRRLPGYQPSTREAEDIIALCSQVDGLPLAIELAASWSDLLNPAQILAHLRNDLQVVWHGAADRPQRQQSLWAVFDYSWQMLSTEEQKAAIQLSVLRGTFTPGAALAVAECQPVVLRRLIQASFIMRSSGSRLMIHRLVRQFLSQQAARAGYASEQLEDRFLEVTLAWVAEQTSLLSQTFNIKQLQNLQSEWQHIERAWGLATKRRRYELMESCWDIVVFFDARGTWGRGRAFFETTRKLVPPEAQRMQARLDEAESVFAARLFEIPRSVKLAQRSLQALEDLGVDAKQSRAGAYARVILFTADYALDQRATTAEIIQKFKEVVGPHLTKAADIIAAQTTGVACFTKGDFAGSCAIFESALERIGPDAYMVPIFRCFLGIALRGEGLETAAREQFEFARIKALELDLYPAVVTATYELRLLEGDNPTTQQCRDVLEELAMQMGSRLIVGRAITINAIQYFNLGLFKRGSQFMRIGVGMLWKEINMVERTRLLSTISQVYITFGLIKHAPQVLSLVAPKSSY